MSKNQMEDDTESYFDGGLFQFIGWKIVGYVH